MEKNLGILMKELEQLLVSFRCFADDSDACDAAHEASAAYETGKLALKNGVDTEYAKRRVSRAIKMLQTYAI